MGLVSTRLLTPFERLVHMSPGSSTPTTDLLCVVPWMASNVDRYDAAQHSIPSHGLPDVH